MKLNPELLFFQNVSKIEAFSIANRLHRNRHTLEQNLFISKMLNF